MYASLFVVIVSFLFIFIYTLAHLNSLLCFYLIYIVFLFAGHNNLSATTWATSWGVAWLGVEFDSRVVDGWRDWAVGSRGGGSHGVARPLGAWGPRGGSRGVVGVVVRGWWWGHCPDGERPATVTTNQLLVIWILILFKFNFVWSNKFNLCRLWRSLLAPSAQSLEDRTVIHPVGERQWKDINWNGQGHRSCANMELGTFCQLLYPDMVHVGDRWEVAHSWTHWALRQYVDQGSFQNVVKKMFWVSLVDKFQILFVFIFTCEFNSFLHTRTFLFGRWS
jgi:hypothetical protein